MSNNTYQCDRPIYFGIAIWGKEYFQKFIQNCLSSLLADGNIPALPNVNKMNKFIFCTTANDWEWFQTQPYFEMLSQYLTPEFMPIKMIAEDDYLKHDQLAYKFHIVTQAHSDLVDRMYRAKAIGSLMYPDTIYSHDSLKSIFPRILNKNTKVILSHVPRLSTPSLLDRLCEQGYIKTNKPTVIPNRILVSNALKNMNTEVLAQNWNNLYSFDFVTDIWRPLAKNNLSAGIVAHSFAWCPIFIDYSKMQNHNIKCLENNTIDGSYIYNNFKFEDLYLVPDSDEFLMISYSPHTKLRIKEKIYDSNQQINHIKKIAHWRRMIELSLGGFVDPLKLEWLKISALTHAHDLTSSDYQLQRATQDVVNTILSKPGFAENFWYRFYSNKFVNGVMKLKLLNNRASFESMSLDDNLIKEYAI